MSDAKRRIPNILSIAGFDPSGGAGVLADVKTVSAMGAYGAAVVTALTAQNTQCVTSVLPISASFLSEEIARVFEDVAIDAVKIGMLADRVTVQTVAQSLRRFRPTWVVLDPVMVAKSGDRLLKTEALETLVQELMPLVNIITPNIPEAETLLQSSIQTREDMKKAAQDLYELAGKHAFILLKGGHLKGDEVCDYFFDGKRITEFKGTRIATSNTHGTGCTLSSAIAALLPTTESPLDAIEKAKRYITRAIEAADQLHVGKGHGPVNHFVDWWSGGNT